MKFNTPFIHLNNMSIDGLVEIRLDLAFGGLCACQSHLFISSICVEIWILLTIIKINLVRWLAVFLFICLYLAEIRHDIYLSDNLSMCSLYTASVNRHFLVKTT